MDYLIEGNVRPTTELGSLLLGAQGYYESRYRVIFAPARVRPTGNLAVLPINAPQRMVQHRNGPVAVIPRDEASTQAPLSAAQRREFTCRAVLYVGPYVIRALLSPDGILGKPEMAGAVCEQSAFIPAQNVEIECKAPGAQLSALTAPLLAFNTELGQG